MKIIETEIPDLKLENLDKSKVDLSNKIINNIVPLLDESYHDRMSNIKKLKKDLSNKKKQVNEEKNKLENLIKLRDRKSKVGKLLERLSKLISSGLIIHDGNLKKDTIVLLKVINKLDDKQLDFHLSETMRIISKKFSKNS